MKILKQKSVLPLMWVLISVALIWSCTENPFSDNIFSGGDGQNFSGTVQLENSADPSGVFVWLEAFNLKTTTDKDGKFSFKLPPRQQSHPGGGLTGYYTIYFYLENYDVLSKRIFLFDGAVDYAKSGLDSDGHFSDILIIKQLLTIHSYKDSVLMHNLSEDFTGLIVSVDLNSTHGKDVGFGTKRTHEADLATIIFLKKGAPIDSAIIIDLKGSRFTVAHFKGSQKISIFLPPDLLNYSSGTYFPIPYFYVQRDLPTGLIKALGPEKRTLSTTFLELPVRINVTPFKIK